MTNKKVGKWRYDIQYGPEGEANYAWVYDGYGEMVATMKTHKAKEIVYTMNAAQVSAPSIPKPSY